MGEKEFAGAVRVIPIQALLNRLMEQAVIREPLAGAVRGDYLRTLPGVHPGDGFFAALIERVEQ